MFKIILLDNTSKLWDHSLAWYDASLGRWRSPVQIRLIPSISFILFFYFQQQTEQSINDNMLAQQIQIQKDATKSLAQNIQSDLNLILAKLQLPRYLRMPEKIFLRL